MIFQNKFLMPGVLVPSIRFWSQYINSWPVCKHRTPDKNTHNEILNLWGIIMKLFIWIVRIGSDRFGSVWIASLQFYLNWIFYRKLQNNYRNRRNTYSGVVRAYVAFCLLAMKTWKWRLYPFEREHWLWVNINININATIDLLPWPKTLWITSFQNFVEFVVIVVVVTI